MEEWSFPPKYNPDYLPPPGSRYWFPKRETMPPGERERAILARLKEVTRTKRHRSTAASGARRAFIPIS